MFDRSFAKGMHRSDSRQSCQSLSALLLDKRVTIYKLGDVIGKDLLINFFVNEMLISLPRLKEEFREKKTVYIKLEIRIYW